MKRVPEYCLWSALVFCTVYQSYRYPLQINTAGMSPAYSDTPIAFQIAKAVILLLVCAVSAFSLPIRKMPLWRWTVAITAAFLSLYSLFKAVGTHEGSSHYLEVALWPIAALILVLSTTPITIVALNRYLRFVFYYALISTAVELSLFFVIGRLPGMAYSTNIIMARFGGFLDDPNGFGPLLFMLMGWSSAYYSGKKRVLAELSLLLCLLLTQSLTALAFLPVLILFLVVKHLFVRPNVKAAVGMLLGVILLLIILGMEWTPISDFASSIIEMRRGSIASHLGQVTDAHSSSVADLLIGGPAYLSYESWWSASFFNFGMVWYLLNVALTLTLFFATWRAGRQAKSAPSRAVMFAIVMYSSYFTFGSLNLPFFSIFPVSFLFFFFSYLVFFNKIRLEEQHVQGLQSTRAPGPAS